MLEGGAFSEVSLLISPALRTLLGRLPRRAGEAAPPVVVDPGLLSLVRLARRCSISRRLSALPGVGDINCREAGVSINPDAKRWDVGEPTSLGVPMLARPAVVWLRSSLCRLSSASFALLARISSRRCCIVLVPQSHYGTGRFWGGGSYSRRDGEEKRGSSDSRRRALYEKSGKMRDEKKCKRS